jgi:hypothetical protein
MDNYQNLSGASGVTGYEIKRTSIRVQFQDGSVYLYTYKSAGKENIKKMKELAQTGAGLQSYISRVVKKGYARKLE